MYFAIALGLLKKEKTPIDTSTNWDMVKNRLPCSSNISTSKKLETIVNDAPKLCETGIFDNDNDLISSYNDELAAVCRYSLSKEQQCPFYAQASKFGLVNCNEYKHNS